VFHEERGAGKLAESMEADVKIERHGYVETTSSDNSSYYGDRKDGKQDGEGRILGVIMGELTTRDGRPCRRVILTIKIRSQEARLRLNIC